MKVVDLLLDQEVGNTNRGEVEVEAGSDVCHGVQVTTTVTLPEAGEAGLHHIENIDIMTEIENIDADIDIVARGHEKDIIAPEFAIIIALVTVIAQQGNFQVVIIIGNMKEKIHR